MGAFASVCVRDCVRNSQENADSNLDTAVVVALPGVLCPSGSSPNGLRPVGLGLGPPAAVGASRDVIVPPVRNWRNAMELRPEDAGGDRGSAAEPKPTPRFDEVVTTQQIPADMITPRGNIGGEFMTPRPTPRDSSMASSPRKSGERASVDPALAKGEVWYEGTYLGTQKHGRGKQRMDNSTYEGDFVEDLKHGQGTLTWDDGRQYRGGFEQDKFHGQAVMIWPDGRRYVGSYRDDRKDGTGVFSWMDGRRYDGQWSQGRRHGTGVYTNAKGVTRRGLWESDRPVQWDAPERGESPETSSPRVLGSTDGSGIRSTRV